MPHSGDIRIDGHSIKTFNLSNLRRQVSVVLQQAFVISNYNIKDNLDAEGALTETDIQNALTKACLGEFKPTSLTSSLSTGQIQLLSLAQAFLSKRAKLVLLDEPTSQIDSATQKRVLKNLFLHCKEATVLMIAHRLETAVSHTDKIMVLDQGRLAEFDHPFKLLAHNIEDEGISRRDTIFSEMVLALNENQQ